MASYYRELLKSGEIDNDYWGEFCDNPVADFRIPDSRSLEEERELRAVIDDYVAHFKCEEMPVFVS